MKEQRIYIDISSYQDLTSGINPAALQAVVEEIKDGKIYILENEGTKQRIVLDENDNLTITDGKEIEETSNDATFIDLDPKTALEIAKRLRKEN